MLGLVDIVVLVVGVVVDTEFVDTVPGKMALELNNDLNCKSIKLCNVISISFQQLNDKSLIKSPIKMNF